MGPEVVRDLVKPGEDVLNAMGERHSSDSEQTTAIRGHTTINSGLRLQYEVNNDLGHLVPRLRFIVDKDMDVDAMVSNKHTINKDPNPDAGFEALCSRLNVRGEFPS